MSKRRGRKKLTVIGPHLGGKHKRTHEGERKGEGKRKKVRRKREGRR